ncbi:Xaa-Pro peptidase family protein [Brucepastera parasyntrophica]|uniref:M24 family metallopeptidase n=1 Tax=Brucepastera parasyntrophica TaxID=2880008 RepID=UPI00210EB7A4|nr:Xaa-Pro peptidase family protein [Brucepastera parasyntrophica]ULQ59388.1 Xaa-Pro peptidase family protein [Brucepastera parasyntrophica]
MITYDKRRAELYTWMARNSISMAVIEDTEGRRNPALRYFSGHPSDAMLILTITGHAVLCPWDENLAKQMAAVDVVVPYTEFGRNPVKTVRGIAEKIGLPEGSHIEIPGNTPYPLFLQYVEALLEYDVLCRESGIWTEISSMRAIKDEEEITLLRKACEITDSIIDLIEKQVKTGKIKSEMDAALLIERESRAAGGDGTSFETLAAGPDRSFGIHAFPAYTAAPFGTKGLSILDFGIKYQGYGSDVTLTIAAGELTEAQEKMLSLVEKAYASALPLYKPGTPTKEAARKVDDIFRRGRKKMPHNLGHGIGLEAHEGPFIKNLEENPWIFENGMVVTLEPGLYDLAHGGCRLENDILITETGNEVLTRSRIIRI